MTGSTKKNETSNTATYDVKVTRAKEVKTDQVVFDMVVNGVTIYGGWYRKGTKDGKEYEFISFPSQKAENGKYYNHAWFKIEQAVQDDIVEQLRAMV